MTSGAELRREGLRRGRRQGPRGAPARPTGTTPRRPAGDDRRVPAGRGRWPMIESATGFHEQTYRGLKADLGNGRKEPALSVPLHGPRRPT